MPDVSSILVVQTDPAEHIGAVIAAAGHDVQIVYSPRDAMPIVDAGGIDLVVIDAFDPRVRIPELAKELDDVPDGPPILLVSASPHAPEISARIGARAFLAKPLEAGDLLAVIDRLM